MKNVIKKGFFLTAAIVFSTGVWLTLPPAAFANDLAAADEEGILTEIHNRCQDEWCEGALGFTFTLSAALLTVENVCLDLNIQDGAMLKILLKRNALSPLTPKMICLRMRKPTECPDIYIIKSALAWI